MLTLSEAEVAKLLTWERLIPAMKGALAAFSSGRVIQPPRNMMTIEEGKRYLGVMPAATESEMERSWCPSTQETLAPAIQLTSQ